VRSCLARRRLGLGACAVGALLSLAATLPALRLVPIHVDEATTLEYASHRFTSIAHDTFLARGGGPVYFYLEHGTLSWPGGLDGLRLPSVVFLVFALVAAWFFGKELLGAETGAGLVIALAVAPLAVSLGTFARPYTMLLAFLLLAAWLSLRAGAQPSRGRWIAAGVASGLLFSVHPIAPLYSALAFSSGLIVAPGPRLGLWLVAPVLFFTVVPVGATHFFSRYMLFALPAFLLLVVVACLRVAPRGPVRYAGIALLGTPSLRETYERR
jgi:uncharacterized membrane protein